MTAIQSSGSFTTGLIKAILTPLVVEQRPAQFDKVVLYVSNMETCR